MNLKWDESYSVGIRSFDDQHKKLFEIVNILCLLVKTRTAWDPLGKDAMSEVLQDLRQYTKIHFETEERAMRTHGYADYENHKKEHDRFAGMVDEFILRFTNKQRFNKDGVMLTVEVLNAAIKWLDEHLNGTDKLYSAFLIGKGVR